MSQSNITFCFVSVLRLFDVVLVVQSRRSTLSLAWHELFSLKVKAKNVRFTAAGFHCRQNLKSEKFTSSLGRLRKKNSTCAARLVSLPNALSSPS